MRPIKPLAIVTVLAFSASLANDAPQSKGKGYSVQQTSASSGSLSDRILKTL